MSEVGLTKALIDAANEEFDTKRFSVETTLDDKVIVKNVVTIRRILDYIKECRKAGNQDKVTPISRWIVAMEGENIKEHYPTNKILGVTIRPIKQ